MTEDQAAAAPAVAHRLHIDASGRLQGNAWITHNAHYAWPCVNSGPALTPPMSGAVLHTNVGGLPGTVALFNDPSLPPDRQASAHFEVGGHWTGNERHGEAHIWQFMPANQEAWHCVDGNSMHWGIETEDGGDPSNPLTDAQLTACAQILEALSAQGGGWGFPLRVTDQTDGHGLAAHYLGKAAWGGHSCPDPAPGGQGPRSHQRHEIVRRAKILRDHGQYPAPVPAPAYVTVTADGIQTLGAIAAANGTAASSVVRLTAQHGPSAPLFNPAAASWLDQSLGGTIPPAGTVLVVPVNTTKGGTP